MNTRAAVLSLFTCFLLLAACGGGEPPPKPSPPPAAPKDPPVLTRLARACVRISACVGPHDPARFRDPSACLDWWLGEPDGNQPLRKCLADASTCEQVSVCMHGSGDARASAHCFPGRESSTQT